MDTTVSSRYTFSLARSYNQGAIALASNLTFHARTKHIGVHHHFIRDHMESWDIILDYIPTDDQVADVLTKALAYDKFSRFQSAMGLQDESSSSGCV